MTQQQAITHVGTANLLKDKTSGPLHLVVISSNPVISLECAGRFLRQLEQYGTSFN